MLDALGQPSSDGGRTVRTDADDGALAVRRHAPMGPSRGTVIALHGLMEDSRCLDRAARRWSSHGWRVLTPDLRGHGASPRWSEDRLDDASGDTMVADVVRAITSEPIDHRAPMVVFGHSAGGAVPAGLLEHDLPIAALLLEDPFWRLPVTHRQDPEVARDAHARLLAWQAMPLPTLAAEADPRWSPREAAAWARAKHLTDPRIVRHGTVIPRTPWPSLLANAHARRVAVKVVTGSDRIGITADHREIIRSGGGSVTVIDGASHFVQRTAAAQFDAAIDRALSHLNRTAA